MSRVERICPECGAANGLQSNRCIRCRAPLTRAQASPPLSPALSRRGMAALAWRATKFVTRFGVGLAWRGAQGGATRLFKHPGTDVSRKTVDGDYSVPPAAPAGELGESAPLRGWRASNESPENKGTGSKPLRWGPKK